MYRFKIINLLLSSVFLVTFSPKILANNLTIKSSPLVSQNQFKNYCKSEESLFLSAETKNFWVNICGGDLPHYYIGVSKRNGKRIRLKLNDYDAKGDYFSANNGNVNYLIIFNTPKGNFLTVTEGKKELVREPLINW